MKKALCVVLAVLMLLSCLNTAVFAVRTENEMDNEESLSKYPIVYFRGNSESIIDEDGNQVYDFEFDTSLIPGMCARILPALTKGLATDNFDEYYKLFGEEMRKVYDRCLLDENGEPRYGTTISETKKEYKKQEMSTDYAIDGKYNIADYVFYNDWRLDPVKAADDVDKFIDAVLAVTKKDKVCLACKCLGGDLILSYLAKYGTSKIKAVCFGATVAFGSELVDEPFSGKIMIDPDAVSRFAADEYLAKNLPSGSDFLMKVISSSVDLAVTTGVFGTFSSAFMDNLYKRLYKGLVPELVTSTYGTWPGYWTMVKAENYAYTRDFVFGKPGSEKYEKYKGLIEKLDSYDATVRQKIPAILKNAQQNGVNICIIAKYGFQMPLVLESFNKQGDVWVSCELASLGATVSPIGKTLSQSYIDSRVSQGFGKYIAPDHMVDASTCLFPDNTWFIKGAVHDDWTNDEDELIMRVCNSDAKVDINTFSDRPQFSVYDRKTDTVSPMVEENAKTETYSVDAKPQTVFDKLGVFFRWLATMFEMFFGKIKSVFTR